MRQDFEAIQLGIQNAFGFAGQLAQEAFGCIGAEWTRSSVLYKPELSVDGNQWCALYGKNLQDGVAGFGDSPDLAMKDFDTNWRKP